ncbi:MAG: glycosyltransferase [Lachnospiraceae bacterium]|nr:glycosyltransferase [Lachnospiraceae bacterium]
MKKFSIITICLNEKKRIEKTIKSVLEQNYADYEMIIVDGDSIDGTKDILKKYEQNPHFQLISEPDSGVYSAMNKGINRSTGEYLLFLNSGDILNNPQVLSKVFAFMDSGEEKDIYYGRSIIVDNNNKMMRAFIFHEYSQSKMVKHFFEKWTPNHQAVFCRKEIMLKYSFDENFVIRADSDWFIKCFKNKCTMASMDIMISNYLHGGMSARPKNDFVKYVEFENIFKKYFPFRHIWYCLAKRIKFSHSLPWPQCRVMDAWLKLRGEGKTLEDFFTMNKYENVAIYGLGILGRHLLDELKNININVAYVIDQKAGELNADIKVVSPESGLNSADVIIVTVVYDFYNIKKLLSAKTKARIVALDDIIYDELY